MKVRLYEREAVVAALRRLLDAAFAGRGGTVFVVAPAGLGKTSVLHASAAEARGRFDVRMGGGDAVEAALPYGLIGQVLGGEDELPAPDVAGDLPAANRFYAALRRIRQAAADRPLLLALDDLHWADPDSPTASGAGAEHWGLDPAAVPADIAVWAERFPLAEGLLTNALRIAEDHAEPFLLFHAALSRSDMFCLLGRLDEALDMADRACDVGELLPVGLLLARAAKGLVLLEAGQQAGAAPYADQAVGPEWYLATGYQLRLRATLAYRQGRIDAACSAFDLLEQRTSEWGITDPSHIPYAADAIAIISPPS